MPPKITPEGEKAKTSIANARAQRDAQPRTLQPARQTSNPIPRTNTSNVINTETLKDSPTFNLTQPKPTVETSGLEGALQATSDQYTKGLEQDMAAKAKNKENSDSAFLDSLLNRTTFDQLSLNAEQETGVVSAESELQDINLQILQEQMSRRRAREAIETKGGGLKAGAQSEIANLERASIAKEADLSIIQLAKQGKYDSAKAIADRKAKAMFEQEQNTIDALKFNYEENKDLFTTAEQRLFESKLADRNAQLETQREEQKRIQELAIQALADGAPASIVSQMQTSKTIAEATELGGSYVGRLDREAKEANIAQSWESLDIRKQELALSKERLDAELRATGNTYGTTDGKPQNATQALVNSYANRLLESETVFDAVADQFSDPLAFGSVLPSLMQSGERQQYEQAKRNFVNSVLRRESGAVISDQEFKNAELQYFPQAGDKPKTVLQKEQNRNTVINNFYREANVPRPVFSGDIIESNGKKYQVAEDGVTLIEI